MSMDIAERWLQDHREELGASGIETDSLSVDGSLDSIDLPSIDWLGKSRDPRVIEQLLEQSVAIESHEVSAMLNRPEVYGWLLALPTSLRKTWLDYADGASQRQVAALHGVTQGTISLRLMKVQCHLRIRSLTVQHKLPPAQRFVEEYLKTMELNTASQVRRSVESCLKSYEAMKYLWKGYKGPVVYKKLRKTGLSQATYSVSVSRGVELLDKIDPSLAMLARAALIAFSHERGLTDVQGKDRPPRAPRGKAQAASRRAILSSNPPNLSELNNRIHKLATRLWPKKDK